MTLQKIIEEQLKELEKQDAICNVCKTGIKTFLSASITKACEEILDNLELDLKNSMIDGFKQTCWNDCLRQTISKIQAIKKQEEFFKE
jgi:hypothetical protein